MIETDLWGLELEESDNGQIPVRVQWVTARLTVEEFQPYEPSMYCWDAGWTCFDGAGQEFYVSQGTGTVWKMPENKEVGTVWQPTPIRRIEYMPAMDDSDVM